MFEGIRAYVAKWWYQSNESEEEIPHLHDKEPLDPERFRKDLEHYTRGFGVRED